MTELLYHTDSYLKEFDAVVTAVYPGEGAVVLDRTAFYPGGGGQPMWHCRPAPRVRPGYGLTGRLDPGRRCV